VVLGDLAAIDAPSGGKLSYTANDLSVMKSPLMPEGNISFKLLAFGFRDMPSGIQQPPTSDGGFFHLWWYHFQYDVQEKLLNKGITFP
jgi:hypothetical protein